MFDRRQFLAGLLTSPAARIPGEDSPPAAAANTIWVIVGVNWTYNDEYNYQEGDFLTEFAFGDKEAAKRKCEELIQQFRKEEDPEDFVHGDIRLPIDWDDMTREQQWDWLFGLSPSLKEYERQHSGPEKPVDSDGYGWVETPFDVREMRLPGSAAQQLQSTGGNR